jgi:fibrillarin-like pre-rRNA processing protein
MYINLCFLIYESIKNINKVKCLSFIMEKSKIFEVYEERRKRDRLIFTKSILPRYNVYGERICRIGKDEYREWDPTRSKLAAAIMKGCPNVFIRKGHVVLYLGASSGTTVSHVSDMVGHEGFVFALDFAPRMVRDLVFVCEKRKNITPLLENAHHPEDYKDNVKDIDIIFQDIAQRDQVEIFLKNVDMFLQKGGYGLLCIKSRSIDVTKKPKQVFEEVRRKLDEKIIIVDSKNLEPYEMDHMIFICKKK